MVSDMVFWYGGILGALLLLIGLFMLLSRTRGGGTVFLIGLFLATLLVPALGFYKDTQTYLITGAVGAGLFLIGLFSIARRWGLVLAGIGLVLGMFLLPALKLAEPWKTDPITLLNRSGSTATPGSPAQAPAPSTAEPTTPTPPDTTGVSPQQTPPAATQTPESPAPGPTPSTPTQPLPTTPGETPAGAVASDELCPCLLKVTTGINEATITLSKGATPVSTLTGSEVLFKDLQVGDYELSVEAPGYNSFQAPLRIGNNKSLTVYLLKR